MADSINDLLDENQKAAEQLLLNITAAKDLIHNVNDNFLVPLQHRVMKDSSKDLVEVLEELKARLVTENTEFNQYRDKLTEHFHHIERKVHELDVRVDDVEDSLVAMWDAIRKNVEVLTELTGEHDEEEEERSGNLFEQIREQMEQVTHQQQKKGLLFDELHAATEAAQDQVEQLATEHDSAIDRLGQALAEKHDTLQEVFKQLAAYHLEQDEETFSTVGESISRAAENVLSKLGEEVPGSLNSSAEDVVGGPFSQLLEAASQKHESLAEEIQQILEKMQEVTSSLNEVKPVLNTIESIG
ncbi:MAG: hypothetical protein ACR2IE_10550 [Candidatus Sumerlaeaceae bacterium]